MKKSLMILGLFLFTTLSWAQPQLDGDNDDQNKKTYGSEMLIIEEADGQVIEPFDFGGGFEDGDNSNPSVPIDGGVVGLIVGGIWLGRKKLLMKKSY